LGRSVGHVEDPAGEPELVVDGGGEPAVVDVVVVVPGGVVVPFEVVVVEVDVGFTVELELAPPGRHCE